MEHIKKHDNRILCKKNRFFHGIMKNCLSPLLSQNFANKNLISLITNSTD